MITGVIIGIVSFLASMVAIATVLLLRRLSASIGVAPPTEAMVQEEESTKKCALFRHFPLLTRKLAWRSLGAIDETPIHVCRTHYQTDDMEDDPKDKNSKYLEFLVKREDLISLQYGGNKVRTLQHQLAVCQVKRDNGEQAFQHLVSVGSGGSNQVVATVVYARKLGWTNESKQEGDHTTVMPFWLEKDEPDLDNTLNMLSVFSFPIQSWFDWGMMKDNASQSWKKILHFLGQAWNPTKSIPMMLGGNCPVGVLGQAGAMLELAEQIQGGRCPDVERIYVPVGSACTVSGLIVGTVLVRHLNLMALSTPNFQIVGCNVDGDIAMLDRWFRIHTNPLFQFLPLTITHTVIGACRVLKEIGGPDLEKEALQFIQSNVDIRADFDVVGSYGGHSVKSRAAARWYDASGEVTDYCTGVKTKELWVCGHFVAKALQPMLQDMKERLDRKGINDNNARLPYMLWMTKSAVQPRGPVDEWVKFDNVNDAVKQWADKGKAESILRPGRVSTAGGKPQDYRSIMTQIVA